MAYRQYKYYLHGSNEVELKWIGNCGAKGEKRAPRVKPTPEQIKRQNQINKATRVRRIIKRNFSPGDLWITLKYPAGTRKPPPEVKKDFENFIDRLKRRYKKYDCPLKWIRRIEIGSLGGIHIHFLANRIKGIDTEQLIENAWGYHIYYARIYEEGGYDDLASYIVKQPEEEEEGYQQLSLFEQEEVRILTSYSCSRNLIRPEPEVKEYKAWTVRKILEEGPKPTEGFYIDKDSVRQGINPYTGYSYLKYVEYKLDKDKPPERRQI